MPVNYQSARIDELVARVEWFSGGGGFGLCRVANMMAWEMDRPDKSSGKGDLVSIVAVGLPKEKYTIEELRLIAGFADRVTARYDRLFGFRRGANMILIDKMSDGRWLRKRLSWTEGSMVSDTLADAIAVMER